MKRIAVLIDGSNFSAAAKQIGYRPDYKKILDYYSLQGELAGAYYFTALPPKEIITSLRKVTDYLQTNGWRVITKEYKTYDGIIKGNMDVEIAVKAMQISSRIDNLILFSGDGDFRSMVEAVQDMTVHVTAVSIHSYDENCMISEDLRRQVDKFVDLRDLQMEFDKAERTQSRLRFMFSNGG